MRTFIYILLLFSVSAFAQENQNLLKADWNGYTQLRVSSNFDDNTSFMLRRMKLWVKSTPEFSEHWSYKIQAVITCLLQEKFFFQDAKITYKTGLFSFDFGQFVPAYSLQWSQPDWKIPTIERAMAINGITPNGSLGVRDIGSQANFHSKNNLLETSLGIFNGYGIKKYQFNNKAYMLTHKTALNFKINQHKIQIGYSLQFRNADNLQIKHVLPDTILFSGNDFRYNVFAIYQYKFLSFQAEYLNANLENQISDGYYFLATFNIKQKNQVVLSYEKYNDLIAETNNDPYIIHLGYNFLFNKQKLMLFFDNFFQLTNKGIDNYIASLQLQIFFK